jgi:quinol monooxygenase YgiN
LIDELMTPMATTDTCCTIAPYFKVAAGRMTEFKALCERFVAATQSEGGCLYYGFCFDGDLVHCREGYRDAEALLAHLANVGAILNEALQIATIQRLEVAGPETELALLRGPLAPYTPQFLVLEYGFRRP